MKTSRRVASVRRILLASSAAVLAMPAVVSLAGPVVFLPNGQGGFNAYELESTAVTLPTAFSTAAGRTFPGAETVAANAGVTGHVVTIRSAAQNALLEQVRSINFGANSAWIGLTDDSTLVAGASEGGNTSGNPLPTAGQEPVSGQRGFGYKWQSGELFTYQNWNGGEPNNAGTGENGVELTAGGGWNDNGPPNQAALTRQYVVEYNLNLGAKPGFQSGQAGGAGTFGVTVVRGAGTLNSVRDAQAVLRGTGGTRNTATTATINFKDPDAAGGGGKFGNTNKATFPGDTAATDNDDFALLATGTIRITAESDYTFGFSGDDGGFLRIIGATFTSRTGGTAAAGDTLQFDGPTGDSNTLGVTHLTPGDYPIQYLFFERAGGAFTELYAGPGVITDRASTSLQLIGDTANGGLALVPEPSALGLVALVGVPGLLRRRRRPQ